MIAKQFMLPLFIVAAFVYSSATAIAGIVIGSGASREGENKIVEM